jgi:hypothetical protein
MLGTMLVDIIICLFILKLKAKLYHKGYLLKTTTYQIFETIIKAKLQR